MPARPTEPHPLLSWWGWGDPDEVPELGAEVLALLRGALGVTGSAPPRPAMTEILLPPPRLPGAVSDRLSAIAGAAGTHTSDEARIRHTRGKSTPDLLALRGGNAAAAPDLVLEPASHEHVLELLAVCAAERVAVVPFGGGTSVVGGLQPEADAFTGLVALDLRRLDALIELDEESRLAVLEPGLRGPQAEALLGARGYTLGHFPQSYEYATLGGFAAARSSGQASAGYGRFDELVLGLRLATPRGTLELGRAPRSAAGPDLRQLVLGSEGALGVITALTVQIRPAPEAKVYEGWRFRDFATGGRALRRLAQDGPRPTVMRLSDEAETALNLARPSELGAGGEGGALGIVGLEGTAAGVAEGRERAARVLEELGARSEPDAGAHWAHDRFRGPYLRDALLDAGLLVETLETVSFWSRLPGLHAAVSAALRDALTAAGTPPVVLCHISHVYPSGASLYFTVGCRALEDPIAQWHAAKTAASDAILAAGGSISHHHGVGRDHRPWYEEEIGALGVDALLAVKATLDPSGILNPGILLPAR